LELVAEGSWSEPLTVTAGRQDTVHLVLLPVAEVRGRLRIEDGEVPSQARLRFTASASRERAGSGVHGEIECPVTDGRLHCQVPAGLFDLRVRLDGFVSHYFWDRELHRDSPLDLGTLELAPGASLVGWVSTEDGTLLGDTATVTLRPQGADSADTRRALTLPIDERGFFHFEGLAPGNYRLVAEKEGYAPAPVDHLLIFPGREAKLRETLVLRHPLEPSFEIFPPTDLAGKPWRLELSTAGTVSARVALGFTAPDGRYRPGPLPAGEYFLRVQASDGSKALWQPVTVDERTTEHRFEIDMLWIEGEVTLGDEPLAAHLTFGGRSGTVSVPLVSDAEGRFTGVLPHDGEWAVDVESKEPHIFRRLRRVEVKNRGGEARVEIHLPDTSLEVEVVDEEGETVAGAAVMVMLLAKQGEGEPPAPGKTDKDGLYQVRGTAYGQYRLEAHLREPGVRRVSAPAAAALSESSPSASVRLVLEQQKAVRGRLVGPTGTGVAGATVMAVVPLDMGSAIVPRAQSDAEGRFELYFSRAVTQATLYVMPPSFLLAIRDVAINPHEELLLTLDPPSTGGKLHIRSPKDGELPAYTVLYNQRALPDPFLSQWAFQNGGPLIPQGDLQVPALPIGNYEVCFRRPEKSSNDCDSGFLSAGGVLTLFAEEAPVDGPHNPGEEQ
jgi:hypothetical protein